MGRFTFSFSKQNADASPDGGRYQGVEMVVTYTGVDGYLLQRSRPMNSATRTIAFTDSEEAPGLWQGVTVTYKLIKYWSRDGTNGTDEVSYEVPPCQTYAQSPAPVAEQPEQQPDAPTPVQPVQPVQPAQSAQAADAPTSAQPVAPPQVPVAPAGSSGQTTRPDAEQPEQPGQPRTVAPGKKGSKGSKGQARAGAATTEPTVAEVPQSAGRPVASGTNKLPGLILVGVLGGGILWVLASKVRKRRY